MNSLKFGEDPLTFQIELINGKIKKIKKRLVGLGVILIAEVFKSYCVEDRDEGPNHVMCLLVTLGPNT